MDLSTQCRWVVGKLGGLRRCSRNSGYGLHSLYCRQHAKQRPAEKDEGKIMFLIFDHSPFKIAALEEVRVLRDERQGEIRTVRVLMRAYGTEIQVDNPVLFATRLEALQQILACQRQEHARLAGQKDALRDEIAKTREEIDREANKEGE